MKDIPWIWILLAALFALAMYFDHAERIMRIETGTERSGCAP